MAIVRAFTKELNTHLVKTEQGVKLLVQPTENHISQHVNMPTWFAKLQPLLKSYKQSIDAEFSLRMRTLIGEEI